MKSESPPSAPPGTGFEVTERVRWADVDKAGIIFFGAYARLIEVAEGEFYRSLGYTYASLDALGLDDQLIVRPRVSGVGIHSVRLKINVHRLADQALLAEVTLVSACVNNARKPAPLPEEFAEALRAQIPRQS
jgi:acyl-CoA thioester hydrolase